MITAPFNFVPLSEKVFFPDWAENVSHDIPFEDGESGVIDITITAKSPMFIRDHENPGQFCNYNGEYYIPATSVKGMVRNVLEIMSFGKITIDKKTHTKTMSVRDMTNRQKLVGTADGCGFLKQNSNGDWIIVDYGKSRTIEYTNRRNKIIQNGNETINCNFDTAQEKYSENGLYQRISVKSFLKDLKNRNGNVIGTKRVAEIVNRANNAYLILTGGIDNKKNEFVFADSDKQEEPIKDIDEVVEKFKKVYFESDSVDGSFWRDNWDKDIGIPIFYMKKDNTITDIGLSQLFKLAYNYTINEATKQNLEIIERNNKEFIKLDLAETIFGTTAKSLDKKEDYSLKGRVQFSHFRIEEDDNPQEYGEVYTVLGSPNPSFYPEYIEQNCQENGKVLNDSYNTLMDNRAKISGWKRYPLRYGKPNITLAEEGTDSATRFIPLGTYNQDKFNEFSFSGKVRFHNLKKIEIGALISALTFHNNQENFYHNIGMAKSLGLGKVKITVDTTKYQEHFIEYEILMNRELNRSWIETEQIKELFIMAYRELNIDDKLKYLKLDPDKKINKFVDAKNERIKGNYVGRDCLPKVSDMFNIGDNYPKSLLTKEVLEKIKQDIQAKKEQEKFNNELNIVQMELDKKDKDTEDVNLQIIENFIKNYPNYEEIESIKTFIREIESKMEGDKFTKINQQAQKAFDEVKKKKGTGLEKAKKSFIKKWSASKNNKGSEFVLDLVKKVEKLK